MCDIGTDQVYVTFDSKYTSKSKLYSGTFYADPLYNQSQGDPHDIALVVFDRPIRGITPARLPTLGQFESLAPDQQFTSVGYGGQEAINQPGGPLIGYLDTRASTRWGRSTRSTRVGCASHRTRRLATVEPARATPVARTSLARAPPRPILIAGITITGDALCKSTNVIYRLDTDSARALFLSQFVTLP